MRGRSVYGRRRELWLETFEPWLSSKTRAHIHVYNLVQSGYQLVLVPESDTCLVVVTVFKIVAPTFCVGG